MTQADVEALLGGKGSLTKSINLDQGEYARLWLRNVIDVVILFNQEGNVEGILIRGYDD